MTTYAIIAGLIGAAAALIMYFARRRERLARDAGRAEIIQQSQEADNAAQRKAGDVLSEHRTVDDAARRLSNGDF